MTLGSRTSHASPAMTCAQRPCERRWRYGAATCLGRVDTADPDGQHAEPARIGRVAVRADEEPARDGEVLEHDLPHGMGDAFTLSEASASARGGGARA